MGLVKGDNYLDKHRSFPALKRANANIRSTHRLRLPLNSGVGQKGMLQILTSDVF